MATILIGIGFNSIASATSHLDDSLSSLCGRYTDPQDAQQFYSGDDPEGDGAGFQPCWYGGIGLGYSYVSPDGEASNFLLDSNENHDGGIQLFVGKRFTANWFGEFKYADLGEAGLTNRNPGVAAMFPDAAITYKVPSIMAGYLWRVEERWQPFVKFGLAFISNKSINSPAPFENQTSVQVAVAGGVNYHFERSPWFLRGDIDLYDRDAWYLGVAIARNFGPEGRERPVEMDGDGDGVIDANDDCPATPPTRIVDSRGCELDGDQDKVVDGLDLCPNTPPGRVVDSSGCQLDSDSDGVLDGEDLCSNTAFGVNVNAYGCELEVEIRFEGVTFDTARDEPRLSAESNLNKAAQVLLNQPDIRVEIAGHTDSRGSAENNRDLSNRRANRIRDFLIEKGVPAEQLSARGYGEDEPVADNDTAEGRSQNRRVVFKILE